jgi:DNA-binding transcriptional regulator YdaS (Cro superfamily)
MARKTTAAGMKRAVEIFGSQVALAQRMGVSQAAVSYWLTQAKTVPAERAVQIEAVTEGEVSRKELRPDLWG